MTMPAVLTTDVPRRRRFDWRWQRLTAAGIRVDDLGSETVLAVGYALAYIGLAAVIPFFIKRFPMPIWGASDYLQDFSYAVVFKIAFLLVLPWLAFLRLGYGVDDLVLGWRLRPSTLLAVLVAFAAGASLNLDRATAIGTALDTLPPAEGLERVAAGSLLALLMAGLPEEIFFRGILQTRLEKSAGRVVAIVVTAVLFTAWHLPPRLALSHGVEGEAGDLVSVLLGTGGPVLLVGLVLGLAWDRWRNLPALIALHWGIDLLPIVSSLLRIPPK
jgi:membrane protease YdiL (CAAX protease family)